MILTTSLLKEKYHDYVNSLDKIKREVDQGNLFRLAKGLYETDKTTDPMFLAAPLLSPSYISFEYALSYYGFIPERVYAITSASLMVRKNKTYVNNFGTFKFSDIPPEAFPEGTYLIENKGYIARIASKEKALCDALYKWPVVYSIKDLKQLLFEDKRIDEEEFANLDFKNLIKLASLYHKTNHKLLIKFVEKEYLL